MRQWLAALCAVLMLAIPCASILAQSPAPTHCHLCTQCDQMHTVNVQPCCDQQPVPATPQQPQTLEAPAVIAHITLPLGISAHSALHRGPHTATPPATSPQQTTILRI